MEQKQVSFISLLRIIFVFFSLFILGDAFYRWDGFSYYASISEFLPGAALVFILWSIIAVMTTFFIWLPLRIFRFLRQQVGWEIDEGNLIIFLFCFVLLGIISWYGKRSLIHEGLSFELKLLITVPVIAFAFLISWILRGKLSFLLERITPLVWIFSILVLFSIPLVIYHAWIKDYATEHDEHKKAIAADHGKPNIILITFDALATRDMSLYGYKRETTPFISKWAENANVFTNVKASDGYTTPATASLMTGKRLWTHQTYHQRSAVPNGNVENIALILKKNGYYAISYVENKNASPISLNIFKGFNFYKSFIPEEQDPLSKFHSVLYRLFFGKIKLYDWILLEDFAPTYIFKKFVYYPFYYQIFKSHVWEEKGELPVNSVSLLDRFIADFSANNYSEPLFVWLHLMPPHEPYLPPEPFMGTFDSSPRLRTLDKQFEYRSAVSDHITKTGRFFPEDFDLLNSYRARYDENILYCDSEFKDFIDRLASMNKLDNTIIILSADHGEIFEHERLGHGGVFYEPVLNIPLIIKLPGQNYGHTVNDIIEQIDIPATILDLAGISLPSWMEGRSLTPLLYNKTIPSKPAFSMHLEANRGRGYPINKGLFAVWEGDYKLIHRLETGESMLFNLKLDPDEQNNLINKQPEIAKRMLRLIMDNLKTANEKILNK
jgi:arylsulfatase A-like enzyme